MAMSFTASLDRNLEEIKRPPALPLGHYIWQVTKHPDIEEFESSKTGKKFERVTFVCSCVSAWEDVDTDELAAFGNVQGQINRKAFLVPVGDSEGELNAAIFRVKRFLGHCGIDVEAPNFTLGQGIADSVNMQFLGEVTHRADPNDPEVTYAEIGRTALVE